MHTHVKAPLRSGGKNGDALLGATAIITTFVAMTVSAYAVIAAFGPVPIHMPFEKRVLSQSWLPQGWKFFTRNPREDVQFLFVRDSLGNWMPFGFGANTRPVNWFGISRKNRAQGVEIARLLQDIPKEAWMPTRGDPIEALEKCPLVVTVENNSSRPTIRGIIGVVEQPHVPWAWFAKDAKVIMPSKVIKIEVKCS
jgi:antimicrobial peptide system SdpA family protein